jgi:hypothetical protein
MVRWNGIIKIIILSCVLMMIFIMLVSFFMNHTGYIRVYDNYSLKCAKI